MLFGDLCALSLCSMTKTKKTKKQSEELPSGVTSFFFSKLSLTKKKWHFLLISYS